MGYINETVRMAFLVSLKNHSHSGLHTHESDEPDFDKTK